MKEKRKNVKMEWNEVKLFKLSEEDAKNPVLLRKIADLEKECFQDPWSETILAETIQSPLDVVWICCQEKEILAYCDLRIFAGEGELMRIAVRKDRRRQGFAKQLMDAMLSDSVAQGCTEWILEVRESNQSALKLYEFYGFEQEGIRKDYYKYPIENAVLMRRRQL